MLRLLLLATTVCLLATPAAAQAVKPEEVAREYLRVAHEQGMQATGRLFHPDELLELKSVFVRLLELEERDGGKSLREVMFGSGVSLETARKRKPVEFFSGMMRFMQLQMESMSIRIGESALIGTVYEDAQLAHVVARVRMETGGATNSSVDVLSMKRDGDSWGLLLQSEIQQLMAALVRRIEVAETQGAPPAQ